MTQELFEIDRRRITSAGGTASIDLMLDLIAQAHGPQLAIQVSEQFVLGRIRPRKDHQRMEVATRYGINNKKLVQVIGEMEQHSEPPLSTLQLAESIKVTRRQLERLFRLHLNDTPSNFYLRLRLDKARQLLRQTDMSVLEVSIACGLNHRPTSPVAIGEVRTLSARNGVLPKPEHQKIAASAALHEIPVELPRLRSFDLAVAILHSAEQAAL